MATNIQFDEEQQYQRPAQANQKSLFVRLVLSTGVVSTDRGANYVLLAVAIIAIVLTFMISAPTKPSSTQTDKIQAQSFMTPGINQGNVRP
jgi:hypothetical protein